LFDQEVQGSLRDFTYGSPAPNGLLGFTDMAGAKVQ
jgi:hypothetical protein